MEITDVINPLYVESKSVVTASVQHTATAAIENTQPGVCLKCKQPMGRANLGMSMGHLEIHYCAPCRVAEPIPNS